jgi:hypothetical protein
MSLALDKGGAVFVYEARLMLIVTVGGVMLPAFPKIEQG